MMVEELKLRIDEIASLGRNQGRDIKEVKSRTDGLYNGWFDKYGRPYSYGRSIDKDGRPIDRDGRLIDRHGRLIDRAGRPLPIAYDNSGPNWRPQP